MKKLIFCASAALVMLASCGKSEVCGCIDTAANVQKELQAAKGDKTKEKAIEEKYKSDEEKCKKLGEGKSEEDRKKIMEEAKKCDGWAELEKLDKKEMK
jgi:hypothetical protein